MIGKLLVAALGLCAISASAQTVTVTQQSRLLQGVEGPAYYPVLNSAGNKLLFASGEQVSLKIYDFDMNVVSRICEGNGSGIDARFSPEGNVYYVTQKRNTQTNLVYRTGYRYDVAQAASSVVLEPQHGAVLPQVGTLGVAINGPRKAFKSTANIGNSVYTTGSKLVLTVNGKKRELSPVESFAGYLWASLSPDGTRIAFFAAGKGTVVCDLNGCVIAMLGNYEMPSWYNNNYLVAQNAKDDGHQFVSSQIMLLKADGSFATALTTPASMTMQPTSAAGRIVYTTIDGNLYEMKINITEP